MKSNTTGQVKKKKPSVRNQKAKTWHIFSKYIRLRDCMKTTGTIDNGKCVTCGRLVRINECDAGHFISRRFNSTLFDEKNVHLQCKGCNCFGGQPLEYRRQIVRMYGEGYDIILEDKATELKQFTIQELNELEEYYRDKIKQMEV